MNNELFSDFSNECLSNLEKENPDINNLTIEQLDSIKKCFENRISIITGKAGTGKTKLIDTIIKISNNVNPNIKIGLTALSGMATKNISNSLKLNLNNVETINIHKLLDGNGIRRFRYNETILLNKDIIIVDECSMIDLRMFYHLFQAISTKIEKIILVGDSNQLPPISTGIVFEDLIESNIISTSKLTKNFRQNENEDLLRFANDIIENNNTYTKEDFLKIIEENKIKGINFLFNKNTDDLKEFLVSEYLTSSYENCNLKNLQIISNINTEEKDYFYSTKTINNFLKRRLCNHDLDLNEYYFKQRVLFTRNKFKKDTYLKFDIFNGDIGYICSIKDIKSEYKYLNKIYKKEVKILIDNNFIECYLSKDDRFYLKNKLNIEIKIECGFCVSVHKLQGGEYKKIIYIASGSNRPSNFHTKRTVYTALTRAKEEIIICGNKDVFLTQLTNDFVKPKTSLVEFLKDELEY
ncbi:exodeoxyribonuclease V alpha subunit [Spiroplasma gladiatoris]|uniref:Exodeoxyribonuclease V alpha subunit n=1 Tax=Spiroplasma gladiatoris TaxID=2143 RepID=A0A4P7AHX7_9MOLU|nr:AAA family ATPase [Spiroplasma gladiatoris]QBQ07847.1 exodeoxyribonuclease V alpha subunit [Spiroplasma gladiatoris]